MAEERLSDAEVAALASDDPFEEDGWVTDMEQRLARELQEARAVMRTFLRVWDTPSGVDDADVDELRAVLPEESA